jgi:hypothetical protein
VNSWLILASPAGAGSRGSGNSVNVPKYAKFGVDRPVVGPDLPTVLTLGVDFAKPGLPLADQGRLGRAELLSTPSMDYEKQWFRLRER